MQLMSRFYQLVGEIKGWIQRGELVDQVAEQLKLKGVPSDEEVAEATSLRLQRWIDQTRLRARKVLTERECTRVNEALFVMAALVDELFLLELEWPGRKHWQTVLLEEKVFCSSFAGERFFSRAARLLNERTLDAQQQKLVALDWLTLGHRFGALRTQR